MAETEERKKKEKRRKKTKTKTKKRPSGLVARWDRPKNTIQKNARPSPLLPVPSYSTFSPLLPLPFLHQQPHPTIMSAARSIARKALAAAPKARAFSTLVRPTVLKASATSGPAQTVSSRLLSLASISPSPTAAHSLFDCLCLPALG